MLRIYDSLKPGPVWVFPCLSSDKSPHLACLAGLLKKTLRKKRGETPSLLVRHRGILRKRQSAAATPQRFIKRQHDLRSSATTKPNKIGRSKNSSRWSSFTRMLFPTSTVSFGIPFPVCLGRGVLCFGITLPAHPEQALLTVSFHQLSMACGNPRLLPPLSQVMIYPPFLINPDANNFLVRTPPMSSLPTPSLLTSTRPPETYT